jgi:Ca2+-binding RTX toxin-like protein
MDLGVQTHFSQGWNQSFVELAAKLGVTEIRDSQPWASVEKAPGVYNFTPRLSDYMAKADKAGIDTLLTFASANALYDSGYTPYTDAGRDAYANYIVQVLKKYPGQVQEIEIWNEFNSDNFTGVAAGDETKYYILLLKAVHDKVKPLFPDVAILGASVNVVGVGAMESLFKLGALDYMDGVAIHPYRSAPEHVDAEIQHLKDVMGKYGAVKPIYATEFGNQFDNAEQVPDFMLKMVTLMASQHVEEAYWYALIDQAHFENMGLYTTKGEAKPGAAAFAFIQQTLIPLGDPVRVDTGDDMTLVYRFGTDTYVMWSSGRDVAFAGGTKVYNARGELVAAPTKLGMTPVVVKGEFTLGGSAVLADSLMQFNEGAWQYFAKSAQGVLTPLVNVDNDFTSYLGSKYTKPLRVNADSVAPAGDGKNPIQVVERYTADKTATVAVNATWKTNPGDGVDLHVLINGKEVFSTIFVGEFALSDYRVALKAGDMLDFALGPNQFVQGDSTARRIVLTAVETPVPVSSHDAAPGSALTPIVPEALTLVGTDANDTLTGGDANDTVSGGKGDDKLSGLAGDDVLQGGTGKNVIDGGEGFDLVSYADATGGVKVKLATTGFQYPDATRTDKLVSIEGVIGSRFDDRLTGSMGSELFRGGDGDDWFDGAGGQDVIDGGAGTDTLSFESWSSGVTVSLASEGSQQVRSGDTIRLVSIEKLLGSASADTLTAGRGGSILFGNGGDDVLVGGMGDDTLDGGKGDDTIDYSLSDAAVRVSLAIQEGQDTGAGRDTLRNMERLIGSRFGDHLTGSSAANAIDGGAGDDVIVGGGGADTLTGGGGTDRFVFLSTADSKPTAFDRIADFSRGEGDKIDLSAIDANTKVKGDQAFTLADAFSGSAGQLVVTKHVDGLLLSADVNGDRVADLSILLVGATSVLPTDLIL